VETAAWTRLRSKVLAASPIDRRTEFVVATAPDQATAAELPISASSCAHPGARRGVRVPHRHPDEPGVGGNALARQQVTDGPLIHAYGAGQRHLSLASASRRSISRHP
jgi:hypothetical protein